jgi:hypothetical protein
VIDINKPLKAKIYDFDRDWDDSDGEDSKGDYIIRAVEMITFPHLPYVKNPMVHCKGGTVSESFEILPQEAI